MKAKLLHTDCARKQDTTDIKNFLKTQGTQHTITAPSFSQSNAIFERRFETTFADARAALLASPNLLNTNGYCSFAALDLINKTNFLAFKRNGILQPSTHTTMRLHGYDTDILGDQVNFMPESQAIFIINTAKFKKK